MNGNGTENTYPLSLEHVPDVEFATKDPQIVVAEAIARYEAAYRRLTNIPKVLAPADPVRMLILTNCQLADQLRVIIDFTGKQNLIKYSRADYLDNVLALYGPRADRLPAQRANTTLEFSLRDTLTFEVLIAPGAQVSTRNEIIFETVRAITIPAGQLRGSSPALCMTPGLVGNGYVAGQINALVNWNQPYGVDARNITETEGGSEKEADDRYRYRGWLTPESFSTCGPSGAYEYWGLQAHPDLIQCVVYSAPAIAGEVHLYPLLRGGIVPGPDIRAAVLANCSAKTRRPVADYVSVYTPTEVEYSLGLDWWALAENEVVIEQIRTKVEKAVDDWILWERSGIGFDIIPDDLVRRVIAAGAKRVAGTGSAPDNFIPVIPPYRHLEYNQLSKLADGGRVVNFRGFEAP